MLNTYEFSEDFINDEIKKVIHRKERYIEEPIQVSSDKIVVNDNLSEDKSKLKGVFIKWKKNVYRGEMKLINGKYKFDGYGKLYEDNLYKYEGSFKNGKFHGKGSLTNYQNIKRYEGDFENGVYSGYGKLYEYGLLKYEGEFKNGWFNGYGKYYYLQNKKKYEGNFVNGEYNGFGKLYDDINKYEGDFMNNQYNGHGKFYIKNVLKYEGDFKNGNYNGVGKLYIDDSLSYEGEFKNGYRHGFGKEYWYIIENQYIMTEGCFYYSKYNGLIEVKDYDGSIIRKDIYLNGEKINTKDSLINLENIDSYDLIRIFAEKAAYYKEKYQHIIKELSENEF